MTDLEEAAERINTQGFVLLHSFFSAAELEPSRSEFHLQFPSADGYHDDTDERAERYRHGQFAGVDTFPFDSVEMCLLVVHHRLLDLAEALLGDGDIRIYRGEVWAKYTGAVDYDQPHHRDFENHTVLVPSSDPRFRQLEMFLYLSDVAIGDGATRLVARQDEGGPELDQSSLRDAEVAAAGPAGTVIAYWTDTVHRGAPMTTPRGARYTLHVNFRPSGCEWANRSGWANSAQNPAWHRFVERASFRQLTMFGFPAPGHDFWTETTLAAMARRYPTLDLTPWGGERVRQLGSES